MTRTTLGNGGIIQRKLPLQRAQQLARQFALHLAKAVVLGVAVRLALRRSQLKRQQTLQKQVRCSLFK